MVLGIGVGSWVGAMFHLVAGVFIQVLLFLSAGAVIRGARGETQLSQYGGLFSRMPVTALASAVAALAVCGVGWRGIGLSGYFSRGLILRHVAAYVSLAISAHRSAAYEALFFIPIFATLLIGFAMARWWMLVFAGPVRDRRLHDHAREVPALLWPLVVLAIMTALAGRWLGIRDMLDSSINESRQTVQLQAEASPINRAAASRTFDEVWPGGELGDDEEARPDAGAAPALTTAALAEGAARTSRWIWPATAIGMLAALMLYFRGNALASRLARVPPLSWLHAWLINRMFFDELYQSLFVVPVLGAARWVAWVETNAVDRLSQLPARLIQRRAVAGEVNSVPAAAIDEPAASFDSEIRRT
jgi:NADH-quinone oxidoreductase subunit L